MSEKIGVPVDWENVKNTINWDNVVKDTESPIIFVMGDKGAGKTLFLTFVGEFSKNVLGRKVFSNYHLNNIEYSYFNFEMLEELPEYMQNGVILLDEGQQGTHAYDVFTKRSRNITTLLTQLRKRGLDLYISTQRFFSLAKPVRELADYLYLMEALKDPEQGLIKGVSLVEVYEKTNNLYPLKKFVFDGRAMFNHYNTKEIITTK